MKERYEAGGFKLGRHRSAPAAQQGQARTCPAATRRSTTVCDAARQHGQARHSGLVLRVDDRLQLGAHQHGDAVARRLGGDELRRTTTSPRTSPTDPPISEEELWVNLEYFLKTRAAGRREGEREALDASRRSAAVPDPRRRPDHAQHRELPAPDRYGAEPDEHDHALPGQFHADDRRPAARSSGNSARRSPSSTSAT